MDDEGGVVVAVRGSGITTVVAHDSAALRTAFVSALEGDRVAVVGHAASAPAALRLVRARRPRVLLLGALLPRDPVGLVRVVRDEGLAECVVASPAPSEVELLAYLRAGATGYLTEDATADQVVRAVAQVAAGETLLPPSLLRGVVEDLRQRDHGTLALLTPREQKVLDLLRLGMSTGEVAKRLVVQPATVRSHIHRLLVVLHADNRQDMVARVERLVSSPPRADT